MTTRREPPITVAELLLLLLAGVVIAVLCGCNAQAVDAVAASATSRPTPPEAQPMSHDRPQCPRINGAGVLTYSYVEAPTIHGPWRMTCHYR